jgi:antitoxin ParD1/3/4
MTRLNISLPEAMKEFVEEQVRSGGYATPSDYVQTLIREAQVRAAKQELENKLIEGLESGPATPMTTEDWEELKRRVWEREKNNQNPKATG